MNATWASLELRKSFVAKCGDLARRKTQSNTVNTAMTTPLPTGPWIHLAVHILGPLLTGESILVVVDYFSRSYEVDILRCLLGHLRPRRDVCTTWPTREPEIRQQTTFCIRKVCRVHGTQGIRHNKVTAKWLQANGALRLTEPCFTQYTA